MDSKKVSQDYWKRLIETYSKSGLSKIEFCRRQQINVEKFYYWCNKLRPDLNMANSQSTSSANKESAEHLFLPIKRSEPSNIKIKLQNGVELEFVSAPDSTWMANLIKDLGRNHVGA